MAKSMKTHTNGLPHVGLIRLANCIPRGFPYQWLGIKGGMAQRPNHWLSSIRNFPSSVYSLNLSLPGSHSLLSSWCLERTFAQS